jgi:hypothetical protein
MSISGTTTSIASNVTTTLTLTGAKTYVLQNVQTNSAAWVRFYTDPTSLSNDSGRSITTDPTAGSGLIAEIITSTSSNVQIVTPGVIGFNNDSTPTTNIYLAVTNLGASSQAINVQATILKLE